MKREQLEACPKFAEHGLTEGCALCDPSKVPTVPIESPPMVDIGAAAHAEFVKQGLARAQELEQQNNSKIKQLAMDGISVGNVDGLRMAVLLDRVLGDMASAERVAYELQVQQSIAAQLETVGDQVARAKLTSPALPIAGRTNGLPSGLILPGR